MEPQKIRKTADDLRKFTWRDLTVILSYFPLQIAIGILVTIIIMAFSLVQSNMDVTTAVGDATVLAKSSIYTMFAAGLISSLFIFFAYRPLLKDDWQKFLDNLGRYFGLIVAGYFLTLFVQTIIGMLMPIEESENQAVLEAMFASGNTFDMILMLVSVTFFAPLGEEFLCRKAIFGSFFDKKIVASIMFVISSLIFGLLHYGFDGQLLSLLPYIMMGAIMGGLYWKTKNIMVPIGLHFLNNLIASIAIIFTVLI